MKRSHICSICGVTIHTVRVEGDLPGDYFNCFDMSSADATIWLSSQYICDGCFTEIHDFISIMKERKTPAIKG